MMDSQYLPHILSSLKAPTPRLHVACFHLEADPCGGWRLFDGERAMAHFAPAFLDIWAFSPFESDIVANTVRNEQVMDMHTVHNTWINFGHQGWPVHWKRPHVDRDHALTWHWEQECGEQLQALVTLEAAAGEGAEWRLTVSYDSTRGQYRYAVEIHARKTAPDPMEAFNLMATGSLADRAETRRMCCRGWCFTAPVSPGLMTCVLVLYDGACSVHRFLGKCYHAHGSLPSS